MTAESDPATVLVVEDDRSLRLALVTTLRTAGFRPVAASTGAEGRRWFAHYKPNLVLLDLGLPDEDGLEIIRNIRRDHITPIVVLSARDAEAMKVRALDLGADDYVTKPFGVDELLARLRAALRHGIQIRGSAPIVRTSDLEVDLGRRLVFKAGSIVKLSPKEYQLLAELALRLGQVVTHRELLASVWGSERADIQYLRVYVGQLRQKLEDGGEPGLIQSVSGVGYRLFETPPIKEP
jgi:two-component system KDP operon response regulator KdpE